MATGDPIRGVGGLCQIGAISSETEIKFVRDWEYKTEFQTTESGPYINHDVIDEVAGGEKGELTVNCDVREGGDAGQDEVLAKKGQRERFVFETTGGKVLTFASALIKTATVKTDAKGTQTLSFTISGVATIAQDA